MRLFPRQSLSVWHTQFKGLSTVVSGIGQGERKPNDFKDTYRLYVVNYHKVCNVNVCRSIFQYIPGSSTGGLATGVPSRFNMHSALNTKMSPGCFPRHIAACLRTSDL